MFYAMMKELIAFANNKHRLAAKGHPRRTHLKREALFSICSHTHLTMCTSKHGCHPTNPSLQKTHLAHDGLNEELAYSLAFSKPSINLVKHPLRAAQVKLLRKK